MDAERRRYDRFIAKNDIYAAIGGEYKKVGPIQDVSIGGLAFTHICEDGAYENPAFVSLFAPDKKVFIFNIPCKILYEKPCSENNSSFASNIVKKRCGVKFVSPSKEQVAQLQAFLENNTTGLVQPHPYIAPSSLEGVT